MKCMISKGLSFKLEVLILLESKMGYLDWRIDGLSGDINKDFKQFNDELLQFVDAIHFQF